MTIANYSNPNDHYVKTSQVALAASINQNGGAFEVSQAYVIGLVTAPVGIAVLGILACFFFNWGLLFRCCCKVCKCLPYKEPDDAEPEKKKRKVAIQRMTVFIAFYCFVLFALGADTISFAGNSSVVAGVSDLTGVLDGIGNIFASLTTQSVSMAASGSSLQTHLTNTDSSTRCGLAIAYLSTPISAYNSAISSFNSLVSPRQGDTNSFKDLVQGYVSAYETTAFFVLWGVTVLACILLFLSAICRKRIALQLSVFISEIVFLLQIIVCLLFMLVTAFLGTLCTRPTYNLVNAIPQGSAQDIALYYSACQGTNTIGNYVNKANSSFQTISTGLLMATNSTYSPCYGNPDVIAMSSNLKDIGNQFGLVANTTLWFQLVNSCLCTNMFNGFYTLWLAQLIASFFLFFAMLMASVHWQYFELDEFGNKLGTEGVAVASADPVLYVEEGTAGVGGGPMLNQPWVMPDGMAAAKSTDEVNAFASAPGSKVPSPLVGGSPRDPSHTPPAGLPAHNPDYQAKHDLHMQAIEKAAQNLSNPDHNPVQLTAEEDTTPYRATNDNLMSTGGGMNKPPETITITDKNHLIALEHRS